MALFTHLHKFSMFDLHCQKDEWNVDYIIFHGPELKNETHLWPCMSYANIVFQLCEANPVYLLLNSKAITNAKLSNQHCYITRQAS